jgi:hypothetical protein
VAAAAGPALSPRARARCRCCCRRPAAVVDTTVRPQAAQDGGEGGERAGGSLTSRAALPRPMPSAASTGSSSPGPAPHRWLESAAPAAPLLAARTRRQQRRRRRRRRRAVVARWDPGRSRATAARIPAPSVASPAPAAASRRSCRAGVRGKGAVGQLAVAAVKILGVARAEIGPDLGERGAGSRARRAGSVRVTHQMSDSDVLY